MVKPSRKPNPRGRPRVTRAVLARALEIIRWGVAVAVAADHVGIDRSTIWRSSTRGAS